MCEENINHSIFTQARMLPSTFVASTSSSPTPAGRCCLASHWIIKFYYLVFCRFNKELQHQIHYLEVSGTGEAWSPQSPGHFQRGFFKESQESRSSKSSAPSVYLRDTKIQRYKDSRIKNAVKGIKCLRRHFSHNAGITWWKYEWLRPMSILLKEG